MKGKFFLTVSIIWLLITVTWAWGEVELKLIDPTTSQSSIQVSKGQSFDISLVIDTHGASVNGYQIFLTFDSSIFEVQDKGPGTPGIQPFESSGFLGSQPVINRLVDNHMDYSEISLSPKSGSGEIARFTLKALASSGSAQITFDFDSSSHRETGVSVVDNGVIAPQVTNLSITIGGGGNGGGSTPEQLVKISGDNQSGTVGKALQNPFVVQVLDAEGNPVSDVQVRFDVLSGGGNIGGSSYKVVSTDSSGKAQVILTLGPTSGSLNNSVRASLPDYPDVPPVTFYASAQSAPSQLTLSIVDPNTGEPTARVRVGEPFSLQIRVDTAGEGVSEVKLYLTYDPRYLTVQDQFPTLPDVQPFQKGAFLGGFVNTNVLQDDNHLVYIERRAGGTRSGNGVIATMSFTALKPTSETHVSFEMDSSSGRVTTVKNPSGSLTLTTFDATVIVSAKAEKLVIVSGNGQKVPVGESFPKPLVVAARDLSGNPAANVSIRFEVKSGQASFDGGNSWTDVITDASGRASVTPTMGTQAGKVVIEAKLTNGSVTPVNFTATAIPGQAQSMEMVSGDGQIGRAGEPLPEPFVVAVKDSYGNPVPGFPIHFTVTTGDGRFSNGTSVTVNTDSSGQAKITLILGSTVGVDNNIVTAEGSGLAGSPITFTASASAGSARSISIKSGNGQVGTVDQPLSEPFVVVAYDRYGNPTPNAAVKFQVISGGGSIDGKSSVSIMTDESGEASVTLTLGKKAGENNNRVRASLINGDSVTFTASAHPAQPSKIEIVSGDNQKGKVGTTLPQPLVVQLLDEFDNPIPNAEIRFTALSGGHFPDGEIVNVKETDDTGKAGTVFTLGNQTGKGIEIVEASANADSSISVTFKATVTSDSPMKIEIVSGDGQSGTVTARLPLPLVVKVSDQYGNPVPNVTVIFSTVQGTGRPETSEAITNGEGKASTYYQLGTKAGKDVERIRARIQSRNDVSVEFTASATPGDPEKLKILSGDEQTGFINTPLPQPLVVLVTDRYGNPVKDVPVTFKVISGGGSLSDVGGTISSSDSVDISTDENGQAKAILTLGPGTGEGKNMVEATITGTNQKVVFAESARSTGGAKLVKISGDGQTGKVGSQLPQPLVVSTRDLYGNIAPGTPVTFEVITGGGWLNGTNKRIEVKADDQGKASVTFKLGLVTGSNNNVVKAWISGIPDSAVTFTASAIPGDVEAIAIVSGDNQSGLPDRVLPKPLVAMLVDGYGNPVPDEAIFFKVTSGDAGLLTNPLIEGEGTDRLKLPTDSNGRAAAYLKLGKNASHEISVTATALSLQDQSVTFKAHILPDAPSKLEIVSGDGQIGEAGYALSSPLVVRVLDRYGNPIAGLPVTFTVSSGGGKLIPDDLSPPVEKLTVETDENGEASARLILGDEAGVLNEVTVTGQDVDGNVSFKATSTSSQPSLIKLESGPESGVVGKISSTPLKVIVKDEHGNPTPGATVRFSIFQGNGALTKMPGGGLTSSVVVRSNSSGEAKAYLKLGTKAGKDINVILVSPVDFSAPPVYFKISGQPGDPKRIEMLDGNGQSGVVGEELDIPLSVRIYDQFSNPVPEAQVTFEVTEGNGGVKEVGSSDSPRKSLTVKTDDRGIASVVFILGPEAGEGKHKVIAKLTDNPGESVEFTANGLPAGEAKLIKISGDMQIGTVGQPLARPITVRLTDKMGNPIPQAEINFKVEKGNASFENGRKGFTAITDPSGYTSASLKLGTTSGEDNYVVSATAIGYDASPVNFRFSAEADKPKYIYKLKGDEQKGVSGSILIEPLTVLLLDAYNNPVPDRIVTFSIEKGNGELLLELSSGDMVGVKLADVLTDSDGKAAVNLKLGEIENGMTDLVVTASSPDIPGVRVKFNEYINAPPVFDPIQPISLKEGELIQVEIKASDPDGDPVHYSASELPDGADFSAGANPTKPALFRWRPSYAQAGHYTVILTASDSMGNKSRTKLDLTVQDVNRPPQIGKIQDIQIKEGEELKVDLKASDPDGDPLKISIQPQLEGMQIDRQKNEITWTPGPHDSGTYDLTVTVTDSKGGSAETNFKVVVADVNHPPKIKAIPDQSVKEGQTLSLAVEASDPDGDPISYKAENLPKGAEFQGNTMIWTPDYDQAGEYKVKFIASDGKEKDEAEVRIVVENVDRPPVIQMSQPDGATLLISEGERIQLQIGATEPDGEDVSLSAVGLPQGATFTDGIFDWTPSYNQSGEYTVTFVATDSEGNSSQRKINISVADVNCPPQFGDMPEKMEVKVGEEINLTVDVSDPDGDEVRVKVHPLPKGASFGKDHIFKWTPTEDQVGLYTITFTAIDSKEAKAHAFLNLTVKETVVNADLNGDGEVNVFDVVVLAKHFGEKGENLDYDLNGDGEINVLDLVILAKQIGTEGEHQPMGAPKDMTRTKRWELYQNSPNPFNPETWIPFHLAEDCRAEIRIYDVTGKLIRRLNLGPLTSGRHQIRWDGRNELGERVASGIYFYQLVTPQYSAIRRMIIQR
ncbi:tandem-95 repeat protein [Candidatus Poribacteria bacterium]|nr:tandem-95 repeat protein [Candidatus Poribacteria bacterium]